MKCLSHISGRAVGAAGPSPELRLRASFHAGWRAAVVLAASLGTILAQGVPHQTIVQPGGMPGLPVLSAVTRGSNSITVTWDGPAGYYQLYQKRSLTNAAWSPLGPLSANRTAKVSLLYSNAFFKVSGPAPRYAGAQACMECHEGVHQTVAHTRHAGAYTNALFVAQGGQTNKACLPCHTVGFGLPSGFVGKGDKNTHPRLAGVQCENCHGPAAHHAANENDPAFRPRVEVAATLCGGCHSVAQHPAYTDWKTSGHAVLTEDMNPTNRISACGRCHSGSVRLALLKGEDPAKTVAGDANVPITCVVCHDSHQTNANRVAQLRNPLASTNDYFLATTNVFTNTYNAHINLCGQCHNHRGASWTGTSRPPHHSPQYNMLLGTVGELASGAAPRAPGAHALRLTRQCVDCHMKTAPHAAGPPEVPAVTGHSFQEIRYTSCQPCHPLPEDLADFAMTSVSNQIQQIKGWLDYWAVNKAPVALSSKYGARSWEYTTPGSLSSGGSGPSTGEQDQIPDNIKKARYNLYLVLHDGSYGVHNARHTVTLLEAARGWVAAELSK